MPITEYLERNAALYGDEICLTEINPELEEQNGLIWSEMALVETAHKARYRKQITWREFDERANQFANLLISRGVSRGVKVGILLMNCIEWLPVYFGVLKSGAIAVPINFRYSADEIRYALDLSDVRTLVFGPEFAGRVREIKDLVPKTREFFYIGDDLPDFAEAYESTAAKQSNAPPNVALRDSEDAAIYFSSGTTGRPKAILHAHLSLVTACVVEQSHHGQTRDDVFLCIPPLYHTGAKMHWFGSLLAGSRAILLRGVKPKWVVETVASERATIVWLLVPWAQDILDAIDAGEIDLSAYELGQWRLMHIGAQPVPPSLVRRWLQRFPHHSYDTNYGLSESIGPGAVHLGVGNERKVGAIGKAGHGWSTSIVDEQGEPVARGDVGELILYGDGVMKEYYKDPEATAATVRDGWLYTGDMAVEDEDGFIFLVDRKKDVIIMGGENIYPVEIEDFLRSHKHVKDAAVIGLADHRLGEVPAAIVEIKPGAACGEDDIREFCESLPRYKRPRVIFLEAVPRNATGKIEKPKLREKYAGGSVVKKQIENGGSR